LPRQRTNSNKAGRSRLKEESPPIPITEHELVPKHEVLGPEEVKALLEEYKITLNELPRILASDPVVREIGARPGDVLKITRRSPTAGLATYYRLVVSEE